MRKESDQPQTRGTDVLVRCLDAPEEVFTRVPGVPPAINRSNCSKLEPGSNYALHSKTAEIAKHIRCLGCLKIA